MEQRINELLNELTLEEKIGMIHGDGLFCTKAVERLGIPSLKMSDGPMGVRQDFENNSWKAIGNSDDYVTYLPCNSALASTWNRKIAYESGKVLGEEARGRGKDVILAPGINIKRSPLCGRNFEYMSEDPYLTGEMAVPIIQGVQTADTAACVKHFAVNSQETERLWVEAKVSDRAVREIYLPAFEKAVKEGNSYSLMGAYNRYKGEHCCESKELLNKILREEWKYDGMVVSDWGAVHKTKEAAESGLDVEMSVTDNFDEYCMAEPLKRAVENGEITEAYIDEKVRNILRMMFRLHMIDGKERKAGCYNTPEHRQTVLEAARESVVLLKNDEKKLPLSAKDTKKVLIIGDNANRIHSCGGGSAEIKALYEISPLMGIKKLLGGNAEVTFVQGYLADDFENLDQDTNWQADSLENGGGSTESKRETDKELLKKQEELRKEAVKMAADFDTVILIGGQNHLQDLEGHDRSDMKLPYAQDELITEVLAAQPETIVVLCSGSPVEMPWIQNAKTLIWTWYAGMEGGTALAEVLFGEVNPSGRLPETFPIRHTDCSAHCIGEFPGGETVEYREGIYVGYRYYDTKNIPILFPFGYGLSYTEYVYSNLKVEVKEQGDDTTVSVSLDVKNIGDRAGKETVQVYVGKEDSKIDRPVKELRAFEKVDLGIGESKKITFELKKEAFSYYDEETEKFQIEDGVYHIYV
ncbi:MAG: beta-glucosidase, partial [Lachnospiraceae bacterium]